MGTINPLGKNVPEFWENIKANKNGLSFVDQFDASDFPVKIVGAVKDFDSSAYIDKKDAKRMDRFTQFAVCASLEALNMAGSDFKDVDPFRAGVIVGVGIGGLNMTEKEAVKFSQVPDKVSVFFIPMMIGNMAAGTVAMKTGFKGDNYCTTTACASATHAIGEAFRKIKDGYLDVCLCGGTEACISRFALSGFNNMKALSKATELDKASTPFDLNRQGFVLGEGAGILCLEEYEHAKARGANIIAEIAGYGATGDAYHMTSPSPTGEAAAHAMKHAYEEAGLKADEVNYINAHGTSTGLNDKYETTAVKLALGEDAARKCVINSTKSMIGHLLGAAGGVEAIVTALSVQNDFVHKTINFTTPDPECDLDYTPNAAVKADVRWALSTNLGFGGHNAALALKKYEEE
jgi:3-oxoacyl-[acyl-carrier-protein] synthase II